MAAYAALASLAQTTTLDANHAKHHFSIDAKEKIRSIHEYVIILLTFLEDYPEKANHWEGKLRDVAHETEDIIEHYMSQLSYNRWIKLSNLKFEDQLRNATQKLCLMAGDLMDDRPAHSPLDVSSSSSSSSSRVAPTGKSVVVGLDGDVMAIKDRLCGMSSKLEVIPVLGMGGIGKTTLARTVYDDPLIIEYFHIRVWVTISQDYSAEKVLLGLLDSMKLREEKMCTEDIDIFTEVYKSLKGRRYLIVMDDVWSSKVWDHVRNIFPNDGNGSRIMLTTRLADIAAYVNSNSPPHEMQFMDVSLSWDLLKRKLCENNNCPPELEDVGKEIARSCVGLPLAVVLVAGFLSTVNRTRSSWEEIFKNVNPIVGQGLERILSLSYTHLAHHLRPCFLFIGLFPEDENIRASRLIRLLLAEGFLKHQNGCGKNLEEEAEEYLEELIKRNLLIVSSRKSDGKIKCCSLHDMVRDLCIRKAYDEKFLCVIDGHVVPQGLMNERRISLRHSNMDDIWCPNVHTMLGFQLQRFPGFQLLSFPTWPSFLRRFRLLRTLEGVGHNSKELPSQVFELFHLRYLTLICSSSVPSAISNLVNLQTLMIFPTPGMLHSCKRVPAFDMLPRKKPRTLGSDHHSLPLGIWRMPQLRHLVLYYNYMLPHPPDGSDLSLENLQTLCYIKDLVWTEKILQMIPNIKRLGLLYQTRKRYHLHLLKHLHQLEKLELYVLYQMPWRDLNPIMFPRTLKKLILVGGDFSWEDMSIVGSLPNLQVLKLRDPRFGETWETSAGEFRELRYLLIERSSLQQWISESSHFPRLKCLVLRSCWDLSEIPQGVGEIPTLELIEVDSGDQSLVNSAKQIKEDQESYGNYDLHVRVIHPELSAQSLLELLK